jgi:DNA-binding NarL/FixJ family response regulator
MATGREVAVGLAPERTLRSSMLVGRATEVDALGRALERARDGAGQTLLIAGEAGVGKSRLVAELRALAKQEGVLILAGACFEPDRALPHAPLRDLLRACLTDGPPEVRAALETAEPELRRLLPELGDDRETTSAGGGAPDPDRLAVTLERFLAGLATTRPLLVVVEDLHWSDEASLDLFRRLSRRLPRLPALLVLTYRDDETPPVLEHVLAELTRERLATELRPRPLNRDGVAAMLQAILGLDRPPHPEFLATLMTLTDGNPFFVEEVLASLVAAGDIVAVPGGWERKPLGALRIPRTIQDAVRRRVAELSAAARETLDLAAVAGRRFDFTLLQAVTGREEDALLRDMKDLISARLVVEESAETFAFRHALIREAVYGGLLARERVVLHRRIGEAIEELHLGAVDTCLEDLAYHFFEAGVWERVVEYAPRAGDHARMLGAPWAAVEQYDRALAATERLGVQPSLATVRARGLARATAGDFHGALADFSASLDLARAAGDRRAEWQALLDLGFHWSERDLARSGAYLDDALALARTLDDPTPLAHSLNRVGNWHLNQDRPDEALRLHEEALAVFARLDDRAGLAATHDLLSMAFSTSGDIVACIRNAMAALALYREIGDRQGIAAALPLTAVPMIVETQTVFAPATLPAALAVAEEALALAREIGWRSGEAFILDTYGGTLIGAGDFGRGLARAAEGLALAEEIEHREWQIQARAYLAGALAELRDLPAARAAVERALADAQEIGSPLWISLMTGVLALVLVATGEHEAAASLLTDLPAAELPVRSVGQRLWVMARAYLAFERGDPAAALTSLDRLYATAVNLTAEEQIPSLALPKAQVLAALGQTDAAVTLLVATQATAREAGAKPVLMRAHAALARIYEAASRPAEAEHEATIARALAEELAATIPEERLRQIFLKIATEGLPGPGSARRTAGAPRDGLTPREWEVAARIARGRTNREIAAELFVGERTVETHVGNILQKLGFTSRTQIAAWAAGRRAEGR